MSTIVGTAGNDTITPDLVFPGVIVGRPGDGDDSISGGSGGDDFFIGGGGNDTIVADLTGAGFDRVSYAGAPGGVTVHLGAGTTSGAAGQDSLIGDRGFGTRLFGDGGRDTLVAGSGNNQELIGGAGHDSLDGRQGDGISLGLSGEDGDDPSWAAVSMVNSRRGSKAGVVPTASSPVMARCKSCSAKAMMTCCVAAPVALNLSTAAMWS